MFNGSNHHLFFNLWYLSTQQNAAGGTILPLLHIPCTSNEKKICLQIGENTLEYRQYCYYLNEFKYISPLNSICVV